MYPGVAHVGVTLTTLRSPPDHPPNRSGPIRPRSTTASVRSYSSRTVMAGAPDGASTTMYW
jgi:hypothetical protein